MFSYETFYGVVDVANNPDVDYEQFDSIEAAQRYCEEKAASTANSPLAYDFRVQKRVMRPVRLRDRISYQIAALRDALTARI